nr:MAG TPA: hypothetical protein [Caudoviricetes sp.]
MMSKQKYTIVAPVQLLHFEIFFIILKEYLTRLLHML